MSSSLLYLYWGNISTPKTSDAALDYMLKSYGMNPPLSILLYSDMAKRIDPKSITYFGTSYKNGQNCDYMAFKTKDNKRSVHVWISQGEEPLIVAYTIRRENKTNEYRINASIKWDTKLNISPKEFVFNKSSSGQKILIDIKKSPTF